MLFERVKELSKKRGISISELEDRIGFGKNSIYKWKKQSPKTETLQKVADYFHVSTDYLLGRTDNPNPISENSSKEVDVSDDTVIMTYGGKPLSDADRQIVLAATRALVEQRAKEKEEKEKK